MNQLHDEVKKRRFETLGHLRAYEIWVVTGITSKARARFSKKACLEKTGNEVCVLSLLSLDKPLCAVGHKRLRAGLLLVGGVRLFCQLFLSKSLLGFFIGLFQEDAGSHKMILLSHFPPQSSCLFCLACTSMRASFKVSVSNLAHGHSCSLLPILLRLRE